MSMKKDGAERKNGIIAFYRRFMNIFYPFYTKFTDDNIFAIAGQSAFFLTLSIVPLVIFTVSLMQGLHFPVEFIRASFGKILSENDTNRMIDYLDNVYESSVGVSVVSLVFTLWSAAKGIHAITNGLNRIHVAFESRNWFLLRLRSMGYTLVFFLVLLVTMTTVVFGDSINRMVSPHLKYFPFVLALVYYLRYVIVFLYMILMFAMIYRNIPNLSRKERKVYGMRCQLPGAVFSAVSWVALAWGIGIYVNDFNGYSIYGGLTRIAVLMVWLYFCMVCLMLGAEFNFVFHEKIDRVTGRFFHPRKYSAKKRNCIDNFK